MAREDSDTPASPEPAANKPAASTGRQLLGALIAGALITSPQILAGGWAIWHIHHSAHVRAETIQRLQTEGKPVTANITDVFEDTHIRMNGRNPFRVSCEWTDPETKMNYTFVSGRIWGNPLYKIGSQKTVRVLIDPDDPKLSYVDLTSLGLPPAK